MSGPLGDPTNRKPQAAPAVPTSVSSSVLPSRRDIVIGPDGRWQTRNYQPIPVYTEREPQPGIQTWPFMVRT